jgi:hypothetical protein
MKMKLLAIFVMSFMVFSCGKKSGESSVAKNIAPVLQKFDGEKYVPTELDGDPDYFIMYFTASW